MYNITKWQYITILVFGVFMWIYTILALLDGGADPRGARSVRPAYETVQMLLVEGKRREAQVIVNKLDKQDYETYKKLKAADKSWLYIPAQIRMMPTVAGILFIFIPSVLVFYTIGWRNYQKQKKEVDSGEK